MNTNTQNINESEIRARLTVGAELLPPLVITQHADLREKGRVDTRIEAKLSKNKETFRFVVEIKSKSTPMVLRNAMSQVKSCVVNNEIPMVFVPYLSPERLADLEREEVSGVDLCGNGVIIVSGRLYMRSTGKPNCYRDSRPLNNPYRGRSAMVARMLMTQSKWESLGELRVAVRKAGEDLSLSQVSKAVQSMAEDMILSKNNSRITLLGPLQLLDKLCGGWKRPAIRATQCLRLPQGADIVALLSSDPKLKWVMSGESSIARHTHFSQLGPKQIVVSNLPLAQKLLGGTVELVPNYADVELMETDEAGFFFDNKIDVDGMRWASVLQTFLEHRIGNGRQQYAALDLREQLVKAANS